MTPAAAETLARLIPMHPAAVEYIAADRAAMEAYKARDMVEGPATLRRVSAAIRALSALFTAPTLFDRNAASSAVARARFAGLTFVWVMLREDGAAVVTEDRRIAAIVHSAGRPVRPMFTEDASDVVSRAFAAACH
jgi:hypothetical protein